MPIRFMQYLRPNGTKRQVIIHRSTDVEAMANYLIGRGYKFEIEELKSGAVSMTCERLGNLDEPPISQEICANGPPVLVAVDEMVKKAYDHHRSKEGQQPIPREPQ